MTIIMADYIKLLYVITVKKEDVMLKVLLFIFVVLIGIGLSPVAFLLMPFLALATIIWGVTLFIKKTSYHPKAHH